MGNKPQNKEEKPFDMSTIHQEYTPAFKEYESNKNFLRQLMPEVPAFADNLTKLFPRADHTFKAFFQMAMYLRREQKQFQINEHAIKAGPTTNLLDRFFIIALDIPVENYHEKTVTIEELDQIFIEYFRIFVNDPEKGSIEKLLKFMGRTEKSFILRAFTQDIRDYFPNVIRYLKEYYALKFKKLQKKGHLLEKFNSKIIKNDAILLSLRLPRLVQPQIVCLYNTEDYGLSFHTIEKQLVGYTGPWLLIAYHTEKNQEGEKEEYVFGAYQNGPIRDISTFQGDLTGFIYTLHPKISFFTTDKGEGDTKYFYLNNISNERFNKRRGLGFGGNEDHKQFKLWIDQDIDRSTCYNGRDMTYGFGTLAGPGTEKLNIRKLQFWGLGHKYNFEDQKEYWKQRQIDIMKRRKVDKKQFVSSNAELFFEKTFEHRDQVVGEIQKKEEK